MLKSFLKHPFLYNSAQRYISFFDNDNNDNFFTNGESWLIHYFLRKYPRNRHLSVFDVGANIGSWSRYFLRNCSGADFHLFEPSLTTYQACISAPWPSNVTINNSALGTSNEDLLLQIYGNTSGLNSFYKRKGISGLDKSKTAKVHCLCLDDYCNSNHIDSIDFLKIDTEGHEFAVLKGSENMLASASISFIQFEYGGTTLDARVQLSDIWDLLTHYDYAISKIYPNRLLQLSQYDRKLETYKYSNWVAISRKYQ